MDYAEPGHFAKLKSALSDHATLADYDPDLHDSEINLHDRFLVEKSFELSYESSLIRDHRTDALLLVNLPTYLTFLGTKASASFFFPNIS